MLRFLYAIAFVFCATPVIALGDMRPVEQFEPLYTALLKRQAEKQEFETLTGVVCERLDALKFVYASLLKSRRVYRTMQTANRLFRYAKCDYKVGVEYTYLFTKERQILTGGRFAFEYDRIYLRKGGTTFRGRMLRVVAPVVIQEE
jgi:hypothetical protein